MRSVFCLLIFQPDDLYMEGGTTVEYKDTLLMPKTEFPMRGNLPKREPEMQARWEEMDIYKKVQERTNGRPKYVLHDGPPYANGDIHMGHALNKVLKDMIVRYRSMSGYDSPYVPGWDTHGLPIEQKLTNSGVNRKEMTVAEFRQKCMEYALEQVDIQRESFKKLGIRGDWDHPYITLQPEYEAQQIRVFGEMADKGFIYKGKKPVYWSPSSESALAEAEIEYQEKRSPSIYVNFAVTDGKGVLKEGTKVVIWTTTPWTIPANLGIALHPELDYVVAEANGSTYVVAKELLETVSEKLEWTDVTTVKTVKGADLERVVCQHPFYDRESLVILGEHVTTDSGTGCVHTAPGHGEDDFLVGKQYGLDVLCPVDEKGVFTDEAPGFEGVFYDTANKAITEKLQEVNALEKLEFITHSYPHDWRTKKPTIFRATAQWFASIEPIREQLLSEIQNVKWYTGWGEARLYNMIRDRGDWCISRQRAWGVPIPVFYAEDGEDILTKDTVEHVAQLFAKHGSNIWFEWDAKELLPEGFTHPGSPNGEFRKEQDIMDVWFDSGSSHYAVLAAREELTHPADLYIEGSDQYRGWFNSSLITSVAVTGHAPYKEVVSNGFTVDEKGRKMSKSIGNVIAPEQVTKQYGADVLRLWVSSVDYRADVKVFMENFKQVSEVYRKLRNTFRFLLGNLADFTPSEHRVAVEDLRDMDQYMYARLQEVIAKVNDSYESYDFATIYHAVNNFVTIDLSSFYLDVAKDVVYVEAPNDHARRSMQTVMYDTVVSLTKLLAPILVHTADEVWAHIPEVTEDSVQLTDLPKAEQLPHAEALFSRWNTFLQLRDDVLKALEEARNEKKIGKSLQAHVSLFVNEETKQLLGQMKEPLHQLFIVSRYSVSTESAPTEALKLQHASVLVTPAEGERCERCWTVSTEVGSQGQHPELCGRCAAVVTEHYAG